MGSIFSGIVGVAKVQVKPFDPSDVPGFFATSKRVGELMIEVLQLERGKSVLEPSAGTGALLDLLPDYVQKYCSEINPQLREILEAKGYFPRADLFEEVPGPGFDNVLMNPPFEDSRYIAHIHHAFLFLRYGGRLVSLIPDTDTHFRSRYTMPVEAGSGIRKGRVAVRMLCLDRRKENIPHAS